MEKQLDKLTKEELIGLLKDLKNSNGNSKILNKLEVGDFLIETHSESLDKCKQIMDDLIKKHYKFAVERRSKLMKQKLGMIG